MFYKEEWDEVDGEVLGRLFVLCVYNFEFVLVDISRNL